MGIAIHELFTVYYFDFSYRPYNITNSVLPPRSSWLLLQAVFGSLGRGGVGGCPPQSELEKGEVGET